MLSESSSLGAQALVIDSQTGMRRATAAQLRDLGMRQVHQCRGLADARMMLEQIAFDVVLCADYVDGAELSGQALLEELRRDAKLPHSTVFVMLATEATYSKVVEAAEAALDCFLLRPYKVTALAERLMVARRRKLELGNIFEALEQNNPAQAVQHCLQRYEEKRPYGLHCGRMAAEILLKSGETDEAHALFQRLAQPQAGSPPPAWALLGVARAQFAAGATSSARRLVDSLLRANPQMTEAYDVLMRVQVDLGELAAALRTCHAVTEITPGCNQRLQHCGTLAFYQGDRELAAEMLERAIAIGTQSRLFDAFSLLLLAIVRHDSGDSRRLATTCAQLQAFRQGFPQSRRLQRLEQAADALLALSARQVDEAHAVVRRLADDIDGEAFDLEDANVLLALWTRLPLRDVAAGQQDRLVRKIGMRFCASKAITEILVSAAQRHEAITEQLRSCQSTITALAETALGQSRQGDPEGAVCRLLEHADATQNARLIEIALVLLQRHRGQIADQAALDARAGALQRRYCRPVTHIAGIRRSGRSPGGLLLRGHTTQPGQPMAQSPALLGHAAPEASPDREVDQPPQAA